MEKKTEEPAVTQEALAKEPMVSEKGVTNIDPNAKEGEHTQVKEELLKMMNEGEEEIEERK